MRRLYAWLAGAVGGAAAYGALRRRRGVAAEIDRARPAPAEAGPDPRAEELRARLAETQAAAQPEAPEDVATAAEAAVEVEAPPEDPEERRRLVHERGRATLDEIRRRDG